MSKIRIKGDTSGYVDLETSATGSNLSIGGNTTVTGTAAITGATTIAGPGLYEALVVENTSTDFAGGYMKIRDGNSTAGQYTWIGRNSDVTYVQSSNSNMAMQFTNSGYVQKPNQPAFMAQANTTDTLVANAGSMKVSYGANPEYNIGGHYDKTNSRFTAPVDGRYIFHAGYMIQSNLSGFTYRFIVLFKNGASTNSETMMGDPGSASYVTANVTYSFDLLANDYIEVYAKQVGGSNATIRQGYKYFTGMFLG